MTAKDRLDLTMAGGPRDFKIRGTIQNHRVGGKRLLLLFGERHSIKPFIRETLLNVIDLDSLGLLTCVGVEGNPNKDIPGPDAQREFESLRKIHGPNEEEIVTGMLRALKGRNFYFWKTLMLLRPNLTVQSVDDAALCEKADGNSLWCQQRSDYIYERLRRSDLFAPESIGADRDEEIRTKVRLQFEQEWAEHEVNVARDAKMLENLLSLWDEAGPDKIAVLNAGSSHQWRIARLLPADISYYHIEQP